MAANSKVSEKVLETSQAEMARLRKVPPSDGCTGLRIKDVLRRVVAVPKAEVDKQRAEQREKSRKGRRGAERAK